MDGHEKTVHAHLGRRKLTAQCHLLSLVNIAIIRTKTVFVKSFLKNKL